MMHHAFIGGLGGVALNKQRKWISTCIACQFCQLVSTALFYSFPDRKEEQPSARTAWLFLENFSVFYLMITSSLTISSAILWIVLMALTHAI